MKEISVIIPCYNQEKYIAETLESVLQQTFQHFEIIIINDGSTDNSLSIIMEYQNKYPNIIKIINQENKGVPATRNNGIKIAEGKYIFPLDGDDKISPFCLEKLFLAMNNNKGDVIYCTVKTFNNEKEGNFFLLPPNKLNFVKQNCMVCTALYKKSDWEKYHGYDENLYEGLEDWDFWLNFVEDDKKFYKIHEPLFFYRKSHLSLTTTTAQQYKKLEKYIFTKRYNLNKWRWIRRKLSFLYRQKLLNDGTIITKVLFFTISRNRFFNRY